MPASLQRKFQKMRRTPFTSLSNFSQNSAEGIQLHRVGFALPFA